MPAEIKIVQVPERHYVGVRRRVKPPEIGPLYAEMLPRVSGWLADKGLRREGMPVTDPGLHPDPKDWRTEIYIPLD